MKKISTIAAFLFLSLVSFGQSNKEDVDLIQAMYGKDKKELVNLYMVIPGNKKKGF